MVQFLVLYKQPSDINAFEQHYREVHIPLAKQLKRLRRYAVSRNPVPVRGGESYYLVAMLDWDSMEDLQADFASPEGKATAQDMETLSKFAPVHSMIINLEGV